MDVRFYVNPETGDPHIYEHGIDEEEVMAVLSNPGEDRLGREGSRVALGKTRAGALFAGDLCSRPGTGERIRDYRV